MLELMLNYEINLAPSVSFIAGIGYKNAFGNETYEKFSSKDVSGISISMTFFFGGL